MPEFVIELGKWFIAAYLVLLLGRAIAARIAGDHAESVLDASLITIPITVTLALPHRQSGESNQENARKTENTETPENTGNTAVSTVSEYMTVTDNGISRLVKRMTPEEHQEFTKVRNDALDLLRLSIEYHQIMGEPDDGLIPHYMAFKNKTKTKGKMAMNIGIGAQTRGKIVRDMEYSGLVSVIDRKSTRVVPIKDPDSDHPILIGSCTELAKLITRGRVWVYPDGYNERNQLLTDSAVQALPELERNDHV